MAVLVRRLAFLGVLFVACVPAPRAPVDLETVRIRALRFGPSSGRTICPGQPVKIEAQLDVLDEDGEAVTLVPDRRKVGDAIFDIQQLRLSSPQGLFDRDGVFYPKRDVLASAHTGFVLYGRAPRGPAFGVRFPPSYGCTAEIGAAGPHGPPGQRGENGPAFTVFVSWAATPDYTKLLVARAEGGADGVTLVAEGTPLVAQARGGQGGAGLYDGPGGDGGSGGEIRIVVDERFAELESVVATDVRGGAGGPGGYDEVPNGSSSERVAGRPGKRGLAGTVTHERGDVRSRFEGLGAIVPY